MTDSPIHERRAGIALLIAVTGGMIAANSPLSGYYEALHHAPVHAGIGPFAIEAPLIVWINEGLLLLFFLLLGIELKHELTYGRLSRQSRAVLPAIAAIGGMVGPAALYAVINIGNDMALRGWAIPIATDTVVVLGVLTFFRSIVPPGLKIFLTAVAIFDDIGAIFVIAVYYGDVNLGWPVLIALGGAVGLFFLNWTESRRSILYAAFGALLWVGFLATGIETSVAGVVIGFSLPMQTPAERRRASLAASRLAPIAMYFVVPVFGFFNAGIPLSYGTAEWLSDPIVLGILAGLFLGKPLGIMVATWFALRVRIGTLPDGVSLGEVAPAAFFAGVGFTMSLFIATLSFDSSLEADAAKAAILAGSILSSVAGTLALLLRPRSPD